MSGREQALQELRSARIQLEIEEEHMRKTDKLVTRRMDRRVKEVAMHASVN